MRIFVTILYLWFAQLSVADPDDVAPQGTRLATFDFLWEIGNRYDVNFTVERYFDASDVRVLPAVRDPLITSPSLVRSEALAELKQDLARGGFELIQSASSKEIFHIIDRRAAEHPDYPLGRTLTHYAFTGTPVGLVKSLQPIVSGISYRMSGRMPVDHGRTDGITKLSVSGDGITVRNALTAGIPIKGYSRVIWTSEAWAGKSGNITCSIVFHGPKSWHKFVTPFPVKRK